VVLATYEALANSAEHAYRDGVGDIQLTAERTNDQVIITITDHGRWLPPSPADNRGQGLRLMHELADDFRITPNTDAPGTTVRSAGTLVSQLQTPTTEQPLSAELSFICDNRRPAEPARASTGDEGERPGAALPRMRDTSRLRRTGISEIAEYET
jgi:hypothetical protein